MSMSTHVVGFKAREHRIWDGQMVQHLEDLRDLAVEVGDLLGGAAWPARAVAGVERAPERRLRWIERHGEMRGREAAQEAEQGADEAVDALDRRAIGPDDAPGQGVIGPVEEMVAIHQ